MALNSLYCADVPLSNYSLTHYCFWFWGRLNDRRQNLRPSGTKTARHDGRQRQPPPVKKNINEKENNTRLTSRLRHYAKSSR